MRRLPRVDNNLVHNLQWSMEVLILNHLGREVREASKRSIVEVQNIVGLFILYGALSTLREHRLSETCVIVVAGTFQ